MQLYVTLTSPYARVARISAIEHGLGDRVRVIVAKTRQTDSPYYEVNPSGRVPYLVVDSARTLEESQLICRYFDSIGAGPQLVLSPDHDDWRYGQLEGQARSFLDGIAVLSRELRRPVNERSPTIVAHEEARGERLANLWEEQIDEPIMGGPLNMAQMLLLSTIDSAARSFGWKVCAGRPKLEAWQARMHDAARPMSAAKATRRIEVLNRLAAELDDPARGARGLRFATRADGSGLHCFPGADAVEGRIGELCRGWQAPQGYGAGRRNRGFARCGFV